MELRILRAPARARGRSANSARATLVVADNSQIGLWVVRSLGCAGLAVNVLAREITDPAAVSRYADGVWLMQMQAADPDYGRTVFDYAARIGAGSVMTIGEGSHNALITYRDREQPEAHLFSPPRQVFDRALDKHALMKTCETLGIPVARGMMLEQAVTSGAGCDLVYPLVCRTRNQVRGVGVAPWKVAYAGDADQLSRIYEANAEVASNILVQEYHPGAEEHVHVLMHQGEAFMAGAYIGEHHMPLAGGVTVRRVICDHKGPWEDTIRLLKALEWCGVATAQFHYDTRTGRYIFVELNPRYCAGIGTVIRAGFDSPFLAWQSHFEPDRMVSRPVRIGRRSRILGGDTRWLLATLGNAPLPPAQARLGAWTAMREFAWGFGPWISDDMFMWSDPYPYFADLGHMVVKQLPLAGG